MLLQEKFYSRRLKMIEVLHIMQQLDNNYKQNQMTNLVNNERNNKWISHHPKRICFTAEMNKEQKESTI